MTAKRALLLVNPRSRQGASDLAAALDALPACGVEAVVERLEGGRTAADIVRRHAGKMDLAIVGGGDGTLNAAADALVEARLPLGILPLGTANDLARTLGVPTDLAAACSVIGEGRLQSIDLGKVNGKLFFNVASIGLGVNVARRLTGEVKRRWGVLGYAIGVRDGWRATRAFRARIICDARTQAVRSIHLAVANGRHYGGGMIAAVDAAIDDGQLDLWSLRPMSPWRMLTLLPALRRGAHGDAPEVDRMRGQVIEVETDAPMPINTDGEVTARTPARFEVVRGALQVYAPAPSVEAAA
jgi:YegS/Rv2252/BmrU family lipid kinase